MAHGKQYREAALLRRELARAQAKLAATHAAPAAQIRRGAAIQAAESHVQRATADIERFARAWQYSPCIVAALGLAAGGSHA